MGSVVEVAQADAAIGAGARFVVGPATVPEVVTHCVGKGVPVMPGVYTPSEILAASRLGAEVVKVFPADGLGPKYIKNVLAPLPWLKLMPTGGVTPENAGEWIAAGASVLGLGSALVNPGVVAKGDWAEITRRAKTLMDNIKTARGGSAG